MRELTVFVASPGDVSDEREAVRKAAEAVSILLGDISPVSFRSIGWELVPPDWGRPQEIINPRVYECDIFIGVMYKRWGSPTGTHTSGFIEEFEIAAKRRDENSLPEIGMFFKRVGAEFLADPGPELVQVEKFKAKLRDERKILYQEFDTANDLELKVTRFLENIVVQQLKANAQVGTKALESSKTSDVESELEKNVDPGRLQLAEALHAFHTLVAGGGASEKVDVDRLTLLAVALQRERMQFPTHMMARLYNRRDELKLSEPEWDAWFRAILSDIGAQGSDWENRTISGWAVLGALDWIDDVSIQKKAKSLIADCSMSDDRNLSHGAFSIMLQYGITPDEIVRVLDENSDTHEHTLARWARVINSAHFFDPPFEFLLLSTTANSDHTIVDELMGRSDVDVDSKAALDALRSATSADPTSFVEIATSNRYRTPPRWISDLLAAAVAISSTDVLHKIVASSQVSDDARFEAVKRLVDLGEVDHADFKHVLDIDSRHILDQLLELLSRNTPASAKLVAFLTEKGADKSLNADEVQARIAGAVIPAAKLRESHQNSVLPMANWEALTWTDDTDVLNEARHLIDTDATEFIERCNREFGEIDGKEGLIRHLTGIRMLAALSLLCRITDTESELRDNERILQALRATMRYWIVRSSTLELLPNRMAPVLPELKAILDDAFQTQVTKALPHLFSTFGDTLAGLLKEDSRPSIRQASVAYLIGTGSLLDEELEDLLYDDDAKIRVMACGALEKNLTSSELGQLLDRYPNTSETYYYNVLALIDQVLYSPRLMGARGGS